MNDLSNSSKKQKKKQTVKTCSFDINEIIGVLEYNFSILEKNIDIMFKKQATEG